MQKSMFRSACLATAVLLIAGGCDGNGGTSPQPAPGSIGGRVIEGSNAIAGAQIALTGAATRNATSSAAGEYAFDNLAPGGYSLAITPPQGYRLRTGETQSRTATVTSGQRTTVDWNLDRDSGAGQVEEIRIVGITFNRPDITIAPGTTVRWINDGGMFHTVTPENVNQPGVWTRAAGDVAGTMLEHTFTVAGQTYRYRCEPHSSSFTTGMVGVIRVQ